MMETLRKIAFVLALPFILAGIGIGCGFEDLRDHAKNA